MNKFKRPVSVALIIILMLSCVPSMLSLIADAASTAAEPENALSTEQKVDELMKDMTLSQKVGQMIFYAFRRNADGTGVTKMNKFIKDSIDYYGIGGIALFSENIHSTEQVTDYINELQKTSSIPLFIGIDEEGGRVLRTKSLNVPRIPSAWSIGSTDDPKKAYDTAKTIANYLTPLGFNVDFAPVADVYTNSANKVIGDRAFSNNARKVGNMVREFTKGLLDNRILPTLKHFPGHGNTSEDSHYGISTTKKTLAELNACEFIPFQEGIDAGAAFVMVGHISVPNVTYNYEPALFSSFLLEDVLRGTLNFNGIIITDALDMGAISQYYTYSEAAVKAVAAGVDMLLTASNINDIYDGVINAVKSGEIPMQRIDDAVKRILTAKYEIGLIK